MTEDDREWLREGIRRAVAVPAIGGLTQEHLGWLYLIGWLRYETEPTYSMHHDGGGIF